MRWLIRSLIVWAITLPLFYLVGLPYMLNTLSDKARKDSFAQCQAHLKTQNMAYVATAIIKPERADTYCHCVSAPIQITNADIPDLVQKKQPERLNNAIKPVIEACNAALQDDMSRAMSTGAPTRSTFDADGVETVHFN